MHVKSFIIGSTLICIAAAAYWWQDSESKMQQKEAETYKAQYGSQTDEYIKRYEEWILLPIEEREELPDWLDLNGNKTPEQIKQDQYGRLMADMDELAAGQVTLYSFTEEFYGKNWRAEVKKYKEQKEKKEFVFTGSIVLAAFGGIINGWIILLNFARLIIKFASTIRKKLSRKIKAQQEQSEDQEEDISEEESEVKAEDKKWESEGTSQEGMKPDNNLRNLSNVLVNSGWQYAGSFGEEQKSTVRQRKRIPLKSRANTQNNDNTENTEDSAKTKISEEEQTEQKQSDENTVSSQDKIESQTKISGNIDIDKKTDQSSPIDTTLKDLTQQVSAIREYAANQQNRLKRFQDGYDWNILRTFCLRIIRCIDNLETRIARLKEDGCQVNDLEEVRDELIFALESSGIEQFEPEANSEYRGQEKIAEAVKEKTKCKDSDKKGKIEKVLRPGYQFYIDDENIRIVRPAQVRLYA